MIESLKQKILDGKSISVEEAQALSKTSRKEELYSSANQIRMHFMGKTVDLCSIVNAKSGRCSEDCKWCAQSRHFKTGVPEYSLVSIDAGVNIAKKCCNQGVKHFSLVTSGRALKPRQVDSACEIYKSICAQVTMEACASMGLLRTAELKKLWDAGVRRYHCNVETSASYFPALCTTHTFEEKKQTIIEAQALGMKICSGGIFGMGETMNQRIEMAFTLKDMNVDSIPINIFTPIEGTPLYESPQLTDDDILVSIALFRFINPTVHLRLAGGRNLISHIQEKALGAGISAVLVGDYLTTLGASVKDDKAMFERLGRCE